MAIWQNRLEQVNPLRWIALFLVFVLLAILPACADHSTNQDRLVQSLAAPVFPAKIAYAAHDKAMAIRKENPVDATTHDAITQFAYVTAVPILTGSPENGCYSPLALYYALALASSGAGGQTRDELQHLLGIADPAVLAKQSGNLFRRLYADNEITQLKSAQSLWLDHEFRGQPVIYQDDFIEQAAQNYYTAVFDVDFSQASAGQAMAQWIAEQTGGILQPVFETDPEAIINLINTLYFRDEWTAPFDANQTRADSFHLANGATVTCDFMNRVDHSLSFSRGNGFTRAALGLKSGGCMVFVLPDADVHLPDLLQSPARLREVLEGGTSAVGEVTWKIPKFSCDSDYELVPVLKDLGVRSAFAEHADFHKITSHLAFISSVVQNTHIAIDEKGVTAAAFTKISFYGSAAPADKADMILDRPFLYALYSQADRPGYGFPLFIGVCGNPLP